MKILRWPNWLKLPNFPQVGRIPDYEPPAAAFFYLAANALLITLLYAISGDLAVAGFTLILLGVKVLMVIKGRLVINRWILVLLFFCALGVMLVRFGGWTGSRSGVGLLLMLMALKIMEAKTLRDYFVSGIVMYFIAATAFAYNNSTSALLALGLLCLSTTACLALLSQPESRFGLKPQWPLLKENLRILLQAIPLTLILFFFFPRIEGNFGFLPGDGEDRQQGFDNVLRSGDMAGRSFSDELAFRAEFKSNQIPQQQDLYWRAKVLTREANFSWIRPEIPSSAMPNDELLERINNSEAPKTLSYNIIHQPTRDKYVPVLDYVYDTNIGTIQLDNTVLTRRRIDGPTLYSAKALLTENRSIAADINPQLYLQTDTQPKRRTLQLMQRWREQAKSTEGLIALILTHFRTQPFSYNLLPPSIDKNRPVEDFLFNTRSGYCEHYASTFTLLMRWLGVPARVVIGYQGGEWVPQGQFFEVRYSDAHAWSEVWIQGRGWTRVDPTAAIAPERIEFGMAALRALWENDKLGLGLTGRKLADLINPGGVGQGFRYLRRMYSTFNHGWEKWVVNFNHKRQTEILQRLKLGTERQAAKLLALLFGLVAIVAAILLWRLSPKKPKPTPLDALYLKFRDKLRRAGINQLPGEGPQDFASRASKYMPDKAADILRISGYYIQGKYSSRPADLALLRRAIRRFNPTR